MSVGVAERLYYDAQEMLEFAAEVTDIRLESREGGRGRWQVALDRTAFYPESGGQPWDLGTVEAVAKSGARLEIPVVAVLEDAGEVWHVVEKPLPAGASVTGRVDGMRRRDHMQQHTGQHLLSAVFLRELDAATVSFHLGEQTSTIDLAVPAVTPEDLVAVEEAANRIVGEDRGVAVLTVQPEQANEMLADGRLRKVPPREGPLRVVEIDGVEWNACGGTHVASTGRIGGITLRRMERVKAGVRVEFCCGLRAVRAARQDFALASELGRVLSTGHAELVGKADAMLQEARAAAKVRRGLLEEMAGFEARTLLAQGGGVIVAEARDVEYAKLLAAKVVHPAGDSCAIVFAVEGDRGTAVLAAGSARGGDCGTVMKQALAVFGARGGGSAGMAQGGVAVERLKDLVSELLHRVEPLHA